MTSTDARIKQEAKLFEEELAATRRRRLVRLRTLLSDEAYNMFLRCMAADATIRRRDRKVKAALWLHGKTYDQTYRDMSEPSKRARTRFRIEALLLLCGGDTLLLLDEYAKALDRVFPIQSAAFSWNPVLISGDKGRLTVIHKWRRIEKPDVASS